MMSADVGDVRGLWRRTIYRRGNEAPDASTDVHWMQGPRFFADIRQPVERASFVRVGCLRDLEPEHLAWLALQEAFAGELELEGNLAWWRRAIDLEPQGPFEDRARLQQTGDVIDEYGAKSLTTNAGNVRTLRRVTAGAFGCRTWRTGAADFWFAPPTS